MFVLDYGPQFLVCLVTFISLVTIFIVICTRAVRLEQGFCQPSILQSALKEVLPLLLYPLIYLVLWTTIVAARINDVVGSMRIQERNSRLPWLMYSIAVYFERLYTFDLLHLSIMCCRKKQTKQHFPTTSYYIVPSEFTDQEDEPRII